MIKNEYANWVNVCDIDKVKDQRLEICVLYKGLLIQGRIVELGLGMFVLIDSWKKIKCLVSRIET